MPYVREHPELAQQATNKGYFGRFRAEGAGCRVGWRRTGMILLDLRVQPSVRVVQLTRAFRLNWPARPAPAERFGRARSSSSNR